MNKDRDKIAVLGLGNILLRDEGVGVRVIERLREKYYFSPPVKLIDGGTLGFALINEVEGCSKLIVVDAVKAGQNPGTIYRFKKDDVTFKIAQNISAHDIGFIEVIHQWKVLGVEPDVLFFGIEPEDISTWGMELSDCIQDKVPRLLGLVIEELENSGIVVTKKK